MLGKGAAWAVEPPRPIISPRKPPTRSNPINNHRMDVVRIGNFIDIHPPISIARRPLSPPRPTFEWKQIETDTITKSIERDVDLRTRVTNRLIWDLSIRKTVPKD